MITPKNRMTEYFREHPVFSDVPLRDTDAMKPFGIIGTPEGLFDLEGNPLEMDDQDYYFFF